ncbi:MAG: hypothetical protein RIC87_11420 [Kiloniellales bacterium]
MSNIEKIYLHVGMPKTGTTSIQYFLSSNRDEIGQNGIAYLRSLGLPNNINIAKYARRPMITSNKKNNSRVAKFVTEIAEKHVVFKNKLVKKIEKEIQSLPKGANKIIISCELLWRLPAKRICHLKELLARFSESIHIVVYLRNQADYIESSYTTTLRNGENGSIEQVSLRKLGAKYLDYSKRIKIWSDIFGEENVIIRIFERERLMRGDIVFDFCDAVEIDPKLASLPRESKNLSLERRIQESLRKINVTSSRAHLDVGRAMREINIMLRHGERGGPPIQLSTATRALIDAYHSETNEALRAAWFPDQQSLFTPRPRSEVAPSLQPVDDIIIDPAFCEDIIHALLQRHCGLQRADARPSRQP